MVFKSIFGAACACLDVGRILVFLLCLSGSWQVFALEVIKAPTLIMSPNGITPLAGVVQLTTDIPVRVTLVIKDTDSSWAVDFPDYHTEHYLPVLGLKPNTSYLVEISITDQVDNSLIVAPLLPAITDPLPDNFPTIEVLLANPERMEPGFTLLDRFTRGPGDTTDSYTMILDNTGQVVWYSPLNSTLPAVDMSQLPNGNLMVWQGVSLIETDMLGKEIERVILQTPLPHHDVFPMEGGGFISLTKETVIVDNYPTSDTDPDAPRQTADVQDNPVVEFSSNGILLNTWRLTDMLDPIRIGYTGGLNYTTVGTSGFDWAHSNTVVHDPNDDSIIVSVRSQDAVVKFSRTTGAIKWILGPHANWAPEFQPFLLNPVGAPFEWQFHQHAPEITPAGTLLMFDNGNNRASPFDGTIPIRNIDNYSRAVEYDIDEINMEVRQVWEYGTNAQERLYADALSDADSLQNTGNVLINFGHVVVTNGIRSKDQGKGLGHARIIEVTHNTPAEKVFDVMLYEPNITSDIRLYRTERIKSLYPPEVTIGPLSYTDSDSDGLPDRIEDSNGNGIVDPWETDPQNPDSDNDGLLDGEEDINGDGIIDFNETNPLDFDSDNDGLTDGYEINISGTDPNSSTTLNPGDMNGNGIVDMDDLILLQMQIFGCSM